MLAKQSWCTLRLKRRGKLSLHSITVDWMGASFWFGLKSRRKTMQPPQQRGPVKGTISRWCSMDLGHGLDGRLVMKTSWLTEIPGAILWVRQYGCDYVQGQGCQTAVTDSHGA